MLTVGLTGGIGAGKSAVSRRLAERGATVIDADLVAREVVAPGSPGLAGVQAAFGARVLAADGTLDRAALAALVFPDPARLATLNALLHPLIAERTALLFAAAEREHAGVLIHDVALLVEGGLTARYDVVVVVDAPVDLQCARLVRDRSMTRAEALDRIGRQASRADRLAAADVVLTNDTTPQELQRQVDALWERLSVGDLARAAEARGA